ncbi:MAG: hypothetical protein ACR2JJ_02295 [Sphingomicrobium sp.]
MSIDRSSGALPDQPPLASKATTEAEQTMGYCGVDGAIMIDRVVYIANSRVPSRAANTVGVLNMCAGFAAAGVEVELIARGESSDPQIIFDDFGISERYALSLHPLSSGISDKLGLVQFIRSRLATADSHRTLVFGRSSYGLLFGLPARLPFVFDVHSWPGSVKEKLVEEFLFRRRNLLFLTATTGKLGEDYQANYPTLRGRVLVCANGAPTPRLTREQVERVTQRAGRLQVYYIGHLYPGRGVELLLELARREPGMDFHLVGGGGRRCSTLPRGRARQRAFPRICRTRDASAALR